MNPKMNYFYHPKIFKSELSSRIGIIESAEPITDFESYKLAFFNRMINLIDSDIGCAVKSIESYLGHNPCEQNGHCIAVEIIDSDALDAFLNDIRLNFNKVPKKELTTSPKEPNVLSQKECKEIYTNQTIQSFLENLATYFSL